MTINGTEREVPEVSTLAGLLEVLGVHRMVVVERNGRILRREAFAAEAVAEGDQLEIVHMVGGGRE